MVRNYQRTTNRATKYTKDDISSALEDIQGGRLTLHGAATQYNIPKSTLHDHLKGTHGQKSDSLGKPTIIPIHEENVLADGLKTLEKWGFGLWITWSRSLKILDKTLGCWSSTVRKKQINIMLAKSYMYPQAVMNVKLSF